MHGPFREITIQYIDKSVIFVLGMSVSYIVLRSGNSTYPWDTCPCLPGARLTEYRRPRPMEASAQRQRRRPMAMETPAQANDLNAM